MTKCEDYESGLDKEYCNRISPNGYKKCDFNNGECKTKYTECPGSSEDVSDEVCKSITLSLSNYKCEKNSNGKCVQVQKKCSEYDGDSSYTCYNYYATSDNKKNVFYMKENVRRNMPHVLYILELMQINANQ